MTIASGRKAFITGGASGFGLEVARRLVDEGVAIAIADVNKEHLRKAAQELGDGVFSVQVDVRSPTAVQAAVDSSMDILGGMDTLVISAGVCPIAAFEEVSERDWDLTLDVNLKGAFLVSQAAAPQLRASGRGRIVAISSDAGRRGAPMIAAYTASKFGLIGLIESIAVELAADQVTANCVCPVGCYTTALGQEVLAWKARHVCGDLENLTALAAAGNPLGRNATPSDVASAILFFISDESSFLTGVSLDVDGGRHLGSLPGVR